MSKVNREPIEVPFAIPSTEGFTRPVGWTSGALDVQLGSPWQPRPLGDASTLLLGPHSLDGQDSSAGSPHFVWQLVLEGPSHRSSNSTRPWEQGDKLCLGLANTSYRSGQRGHWISTLLSTLSKTTWIEILTCIVPYAPYCGKNKSSCPWSWFKYSNCTFFK